MSPAPEAESLVVLRPGAGRSPLFCIHPAGGLTEIYRGLAAALPPDLPVVAISSRALADGLAEHPTIDALAEDYATRITAYAPGVPYRLAGFSLGGIFALATARALERRGSRVALVALVDSDLQLTAPERRDGAYVQQHVVDMYRTFARELAIVQRLDPTTLAAEAAELARRVIEAPAGRRGRAIVEWLAERRHLVSGISSALLERYFALFDAHLELVEGFRPESVAAPLSLWASSVSTNGKADRAAPWASVTTGGLAHVAVPASHYELMYAPHVERIAQELDERLRRIEAGGSLAGARATSSPAD